jgi:hypothetical protein
MKTCNVKTPDLKSPDVVVGEASEASVQAAILRRGVMAAHLSPYGAGATSVIGTPPAEVPRLLTRLELLLRNLYAPSLLRSYWKGQQTTLAEISGTDAPDDADNQEQTGTTSSMKSKIATATAAFGEFLTALVTILIAVRSTGTEAPAKEADTGDDGDDGADEETPKQKQARLKAEKAAKAEAAAKAKAKAKEEEEAEGGDDDDLLGGDDEPEEVTIEQLRAAGQAALKAGNADAMKKLLKKHGAENLGGLDKDDYAVVLAGMKKLAK